MPGLGVGSASLLTVGFFTTLVLPGEFAAGAAAGLVDAWRVASAARRDLVVDMTGVSSLDGFALRHIEQASRALAAAGSTLRIAHAPRVVARLLHAAGATGLLRA